MGTGIPVVSFARSAVAELVRVSTKAQAKQGTTNIPAQKAANAITCERHGLEVVETIELVESGMTSARSPEMLHILELCRTRQIKGIVALEQSRLTRNMRDWGMFDVFKEYDVKLYFPMGVIDLNTDAGVMWMTMNNALDVMELGRIRTRTVGGKGATRQLGLYAGGGLPLGLAYEDREWSYTDDIDTVREMFRLFLSGEVRCISDIARRVGTKRPQVDHALRNPIYSGWLVYDEECDIKNPIKTEGRKNKYRRIKKEQPFRVQLPLEPVVSEEDFAEVQRIRDTARRAASNKRRKGELLYLNFARCACCHLPLYPKSPGRTGRVKSYYCRSRDRNHRKEGQLPCPTGYQAGPALDAVIDRVLAETLLDEKHLLKAIGGYNAMLVQKWQEMRPLLIDQTERRDALAKRKARIRDAWVRGHYEEEPDAYEKDMRAVASELAALDHVIQPSARTPHKLCIDDVRALLVGFDSWPFLTRQQRRHVLEAMDPFIIAEDGRVTGIAIPLGDLAAPGGRYDSPRSRSRLIVAPPANPRSNNAYLYFDLAA